MNQRMTAPRAGFTLLEVLVAFLIFGMIGVISSQLMSQTIHSNERLSESGQRLGDAHRAMQILQRDVLQFTPRSVRDQYGDRREPLLIGTDGALEFSRVGWRNPLDLPRAEVQRVAYLMQDGKLLRGYWPVLDRAQDTEPAYQTLLHDVERVEFYALDASGNEHTFWPMPGIDRSDPALRIVGLIARMELPPFGVVERVWQIPDA